MGFRNAVVGGINLVRAAIQSPNFVTGTTGWRISRDGSAEFNNATVRGTLEVGGSTPNPRIVILAVPNIPAELQTYYVNAVQAAILFYTNDADTYHYYAILIGSAGVRRGDVLNGVVREIELNVPGVAFQYDIDVRFTQNLFSDSYIENTLGIFSTNDIGIGSSLSFQSLPRGIIAYKSSTANGTASSLTNETRDTVLGDLTITGINGHRYGVHCRQLVNLGTAAHRGINRIRDGGNSTPTTASTLRALGQLNFATAGTTGRQIIETHGQFISSGGTHTFSVFSLDPDSGACTPIGSATEVREFWVTDEGNLP